MSKARSSRPNRARKEPPATPQTRVPFRASLPPISARSSESETEDSGLHDFFPDFAEAASKPTSETSNLVEISRRLRGLAERARRSRSTERITQSKRAGQSAPAALQHETLRANEDALLAELSEKSHGRTASRLYAFLAERASATHEGEHVARLLEFARDADEGDPWIQFSLRVHALHAQNWERTRDRLADEIEVTSDLVKQHALLWCATLGIAGHEDPHRAHAAAEEASERAQSGALACLLSSEFHRRAGTTELAQVMLEAAATRSRQSKALVREKLAYALEGHDDARALRMLQSLLDKHPSPARVHRSAARVALRLSDPGEAKRHLAAAAELCDDAELRSATLRAAVVTGLLCGDDAEPSLASLRVSKNASHRATRARVLLDRGDAQQAIDAAEAFVRRATGTDRVYGAALVLEAALALQDASTLVRAARKAVSYAELTPWVQSLSHAHEELAWAQEGGLRIGPEALADVLFTHGDEETADAERKLLLNPSAMVEHLIALDVCTELGTDETLQVMEATRNALHAGSRLGTSLVLAHLLSRNGQDDKATELLQETFHDTLHNPLVGYQLAKLLAEDQPLACADTLLATLDHAQGPWAASIAMRAGQIIANAGGNPTQAYRLALDEYPAHFPAIWELERIAQTSNDRTASAQLHRHAARQTSSPVIAGLHLVQAALLLQDIDSVSASQCIEEAAVLFPEDAAIAEMLLRLSSQSSGPARALALEALASVSEGVWAASATFRAGLEWEHAKHLSNALATFRDLPSDTDACIVRRASDRIETALGLPQGVAERLFEDVKRTHQPNARLAILEKLAHTDAWLCEDDASAAMSMQSILEVAGWHVPALRYLQRYYARHGRLQELREVTEMLHSVSDAQSHARLLHALQVHAGLDTHEPTTPQSRWIAERQKSVTAIEFLATQTDDPTEMAALTHTCVTEQLSHTPLNELLRRLSEAEEAWPAHPLVPETRARIHEAAGDYAEAAQAFERAANRANGEGRRVNLRSRAGQLWLQDVGDPIRAQRCFEAVLNERMRPQALRGLIHALELSRQDGELLSRLELETSLPHDPSDLAWLLEKLAERYRVNNTPRRELATRERLCDVDPESADAWIKWARALAQHGQTQQAREPYEHAIRLIEEEQTSDARERQLDARLEYATFLLVRARNRAAAREALQEVLRIDANNARASRLLAELGSVPGVASLHPPPNEEGVGEPFPESRDLFLQTGALAALTEFGKWLHTRHEWELAETTAAVIDLASGKAPRVHVRGAGDHAIREVDRLLPEGFLSQPLVQLVRGLAPVLDVRLKRSHTARKARRLLVDGERKASLQRISSAFGSSIDVRGHNRRDTFCMPISHTPPMLVVSDSLLTHYDAAAWEHALAWGASLLRLQLHPLAHTDSTNLCAELRGWCHVLLGEERKYNATERKDRRALEAVLSRTMMDNLRAVAKQLEVIDESAIGRLRQQLVETAHRAAVLSTGCIGAAVDVASFDGLHGPDRRIEWWVKHPQSGPLLQFILSRDFARCRRSLAS